MKVCTRDIGILLEGLHNTIRHYVIHSGGQAAIIGTGFTLHIEDREIWLKPPATELEVSSLLPWAAIMLHDGTNAVIRNNVICVDRRGADVAPRRHPSTSSDLSAIAPASLAGQAHTIRIRDGASNVLIENNTFVNVEGNTLSVAEGSLAIVRTNRSHPLVVVVSMALRERLR